MPQRSSISQLPEEIRREFEKLLIQKSFSDYKGFEEFFAKRGYVISKSSAHRYGKQFEERLSAIKIATEQARAITEAVGDEEGVMGDALTRLAQEKAFQVLIEMQGVEDISFSKLTRAIADLNRAAVTQKKWMAEVKKKTQEAAQKISKELKKRGLSEDAAEAIKRDILGIAG